MIKSAQAEVARHPNVSLVITDGNVDIQKQNNDVDDLQAQGVDAVSDESGRVGWAGSGRQQGHASWPASGLTGPGYPVGKERCSLAKAT